MSPPSDLNLDGFQAVQSTGAGQDASSVTLDQASREHILRVLGQCQGKIKGSGNAAERLGVNPSTLRYRMKRLGIN